MKPRTTTGCNIQFESGITGWLLFIFESEDEMKKHYVKRRMFEWFVGVTAVCGQRAFTIRLFKGPKATYRKNHVTCRNCRRTKVFRGVK